MRTNSVFLLLLNVLFLSVIGSDVVGQQGGDGPKEPPVQGTGPLEIPVGTPPQPPTLGTGGPVPPPPRGSSRRYSEAPQPDGRYYIFALVLCGIVGVSLIAPRLRKAWQKIEDY